MKTLGAKILDAQGNELRFNGLAWFGFESTVYAPHGLWQRSLTEMLDQIKSLGYTLIRLPYANSMLTQPAPASINFQVNPQLMNLTPLEIMDVFIAECEKRSIYVLLDRHQYAPGGGNGDNWVSWDQGIGEDKWIADWVMLATRYKNRTNILGADLANEPHTQAVTWQNWKAAAEKCGNAILAANPDWLIVVEGIEVYNNDWYWWGGQLEGVKDLPITLPNKVVYSPHDYGPGVYNQSWFQDPTFPANLPAIWDAHFGYIAKQNIAPVLVGEFGGRETDTQSTEGKWQNALVDYIKQNDLYWSYWCLNPNSGDTGGILKDDWVTVDEGKQTMLSRIFTKQTVQPTGAATPAQPPAQQTVPAKPTTQPTKVTPTVPVKPTPPADDSIFTLGELCISILMTIYFILIFLTLKH